MALYPCPECEKKISDKALTCPRCGCPLKAPDKNVELEKSRVPAGALTGFFPIYGRILGAPRSVFMEILSLGNDKYTWPMLIFYSIFEAIKKFEAKKEVLDLVLYLAFWPLFWWVAIWLMAWLNFQVGKWFGGKGSLKDVFDSQIWRMAPNCIGMFFGILETVLGLDGAKSVLHYLVWGIGFWGMVFGIILLSAAHRYSILRSLGTNIALNVIALVPAYLFKPEWVQEWLKQLIP